MNQPQAKSVTPPNSSPPGDWFVYMVWDASPEEHGEKPDLVCVFATEEMAQAFVEESYEEEESDHIAIQPCQVVGGIAVLQQQIMQQSPAASCLMDNGTGSGATTLRWPILMFNTWRST